MANVFFDKPFPVAEAERGKFAPIDMSTVPGYPTAVGDLSARGRYAVLTYSMNPTQVTLSGVTLTVSAINIDEPVTVSVGNTTQVSAVTLISAVTQVINFTPAVNSVEIYNNDSFNTVYLLWNTASMDALTSRGLPIVAGAYYEIDRVTTQLTLGSINDNVNVRVFGHYEV